MLSSKKCRPPASPSSQQPLSFPPRIGSQTRQPSPPGIGESQYPGRNPIGASHRATDSYLSKGSSSELLSQDQSFSRELKLPVCNSLQTILSLLLVVWEKISLFVDRQCLGRFCLGSSLGEFCTLFMLLMSPSSNNRSSAAVNCRT